MGDAPEYRWDTGEIVEVPEGDSAEVWVRSVTTKEYRIRLSLIRDTLYIKDETQEDMKNSMRAEGLNDLAVRARTGRKRVPYETGSHLYAAFEQIKTLARISSHDPKTQVGAAVLCPQTLRVLATSVNGFLRGACDDLLPNLSPDKHTYMRHAERNLVNYCARKGIAMESLLVICTHSPCYECARALWDAGITIIVFETEHKQTREGFQGKLDLGYSMMGLEMVCWKKRVYSEADANRYRAMVLRPKTREQVIKEIGGKDEL